MNRSSFVARCICLLLMTLVVAPSVQAADGVCPTILAVKGKSQVTRRGHPVKVEAGLPLVAGDAVRVETGTLTLQWPGGTKALLEQGARVTIQGRTTQLGSGSVWMNVIPDPRGKTQYRVRTPRTMGAVEGTQVLFRYDPTTYEWIVQLWRGKVRCMGAGGETCGNVQAGVEHKHPKLLSGGGTLGPVAAGAGRPSLGKTTNSGPAATQHPSTADARAPGAAPASTPTDTHFDTKKDRWRDF